jgi:arsenite-transporting ATPase
MISSLNKILPKEQTRFLFFGGKGGVGKTTISTATAVWLADQGYKTSIISTDPTVSLSVMFQQEIRGISQVDIRQVPNLSGLNINPEDAKGIFQTRLINLMGQTSGLLNNDMISTPCAEEMASFDQFVGFLESSESDVVVFDTAPTGKTLRELAMPFNWAGFLEKQIQQGKELAQLMNLDEYSNENLNRDKRRYENALSVLSDPKRTVFSLVLLPERLPIEETQSAITGLEKLGIDVQSLVINQTIQKDVINGNSFLTSRSVLQDEYLNEIEKRFHHLSISRLPLFDHDISDLEALREVGDILYGKNVETNFNLEKVLK